MQLNHLVKGQGAAPEVSLGGFGDTGALHGLELWDAVPCLLRRVDLRQQHVTEADGVDDTREQVLLLAPPGLLAADSLNGRGFTRQIPEQHAEATPRQTRATEVQEIGVVVPEKVGLDGLPVLDEERQEAEDSPRSPTCR